MKTVLLFVTTICLNVLEAFVFLKYQGWFFSDYLHLTAAQYTAISFLFSFIFGTNTASLYLKANEDKNETRIFLSMLVIAFLCGFALLCGWILHLLPH